MRDAVNPVGSGRSSASYSSKVRPLTFRHSISAAASRSVGVSTPIATASAAWASIRDLPSSSLRHGAADDHRPELLKVGQRRAVEGPRLHTAGAQAAQPRAQLPRRAAGEGEREHAVRWIGAGCDAVGDPVVTARVLPVPAPASTQTGPRSATAARRCSSSSGSSRRSASLTAAPSPGAQLEAAPLSRPSQCSMIARAIEVRPGSLISPSDATSSSRG